MAGFLNAVSASFVLLLLMAVGYGMGRVGWISEPVKKFIGNYLIYIAVPFNCIESMLNNLHRDELAQAGIMLVCALLSISATMLLSMGVATLLRLPQKRWGVFAAMGGVSNAIFIGIPVCNQLFGAACMPYLMIYFLANTVFVQSVSLVLIKRAGRAEGTSVTLSGFLRDVCTNPPIVAVVVSILLLVLDIALPAPVMKFSQYMSNSVTPLALIYCGYIICQLGLKNIRLSQGLPTMLVIRLILSPVICMAFCRVFGITGLARDVFVVESALPVVTQVTVMAGTFGADDKYAASGACLSTLGSFITIPILMLLMG